MRAIRSVDEMEEKKKGWQAALGQIERRAK
jgi:hypothetical protein